MKKQFAAAFGIVTFGLGKVIGGDVGIYQIGFRADDFYECFVKPHAAGPDRLDFGTGQSDSRLEAFDFLIITMETTIGYFHEFIVS